MARKSFQKGTVLERRYDYGTTYIARWRERDPEGGWREKSKTLRDCPDKKTAQKELDRILRQINRRNGVAAYRANVRFNDLLGKHWPNYLKSADVCTDLPQNSLRLTRGRSVHTLVTEQERRARKGGCYGP